LNKVNIFFLLLFLWYTLKEYFENSKNLLDIFEVLANFHDLIQIALFIQLLAFFVVFVVVVVVVAVVDKLVFEYYLKNLVLANLDSFFKL